MLDVNPDTRITANEILGHKWLTDHEKLLHNIFYDADREEEDSKYVEQKDIYL